MNQFYLVKATDLKLYIMKFLGNSKVRFTNCEYQAYKAKKLETVFRKLEENKIPLDAVTIVKVDFDELEEEIKRRYEK